MDNDGDKGPINLEAAMNAAPQVRPAACCPLLLVCTSGRAPEFVVGVLAAGAAADAPEPGGSGSGSGQRQGEEEATGGPAAGFELTAHGSDEHTTL